MVAVEIPEAYGNVLLVVVVVALQCHLSSYFCISIPRHKTFTRKFLLENFGVEHKKNFNSDPALGGYPDMGNGIYSKKLPYNDWFYFNTLQRIHLNYLEQLAIILTLLVVGGIKHPVYTYYVGLTYILARFIYIFSYYSSPSKRYPAVVVIVLCLIFQLVLAVHSSLIVANFNLILSV